MSDARPTLRDRTAPREAGGAGPGALDRFGALHPDLRRDIRGWDDDPELAPLVTSLRGHPTADRFLDNLAEAVVARHLLARGCRLRFEVETPTGRAADFEVDAGGDERFFLHVKRLDTAHPVRKQLSISSRLRSLERIERPYVVQVRWQQGAGDQAMQRLVRAAGEFILQARVGDELVVHDDAGVEIGGVLVIAPWEGPHVSLAIGLPQGFIDVAPRIRRQLRRAHRQFMPKEENVILLASSLDEDRRDFRSALLGSHVERWDAFPPRGRRVAYGRARDGLWDGRRYADSRAAGWFRLDPESDRLEVTLLFRDNIPIAAPLRARLESLFAPGT